MSHQRHHAIVVTTYAREKIDAAHIEAAKLFPHVTSIVPSVINVQFSFLVPPDGSSEGWPDSDRGNERRDEFIRWLEAQRYEDGSQPFKWVEISYGEDGNAPDHITRCASRLDHASWCPAHPSGANEGPGGDHLCDCDGPEKPPPATA